MRDGTRLTCYVASPSGFAESTRYWYEEKLLPLIRTYVDVVDPWAVDPTNILEASDEVRPGLWLDLGDHHYDTIRDVDMMVAILDQEPPDNGTVAEVAWAAAHGKPVIGYRNDLRSNGEEGLPYNLMIGAAIRRSGGIAVSDLVQLETELKRRSGV